MNITEAHLLILAKLLFRLTLPLLITAIFGFGMNRLVDYWIDESNR